MLLSESLGDYLETIYHLVEENKVARVKEIAERMQVHMSSVTGALKSLADRNLVNHDPYSLVTLTPRGETAARELVRCHRLLSEFFERVLSLDSETAERNACRMEHAMDRRVLNRLAVFVQFVQECPRAGEDWLQQFRAYFESAGNREADIDKALEWADHFKETLEEKRQGGKGRMSTLDQLKPGEKGKIVRIGSAGALKRRIVDMGVVRGTPVEVIKVAPLGDPIEIKVKGYNLTLRKEEAAAISVEPE